MMKKKKKKKIVETLGGKKKYSKSELPKWKWQKNFTFSERKTLEKFRRKVKKNE